MADETRPDQKVLTANHDYHEAIDEVMQDEILPVADKATLGSHCKLIFTYMVKVNELLADHYDQTD